MIDDGLAYRRDYHEMPPRVEYGLTELGREMLPIIDALADFGRYYQSVARYGFRQRGGRGGDRQCATRREQ